MIRANIMLLQTITWMNLKIQWRKPKPKEYNCILRNKKDIMYALEFRMLVTFQRIVPGSR